MGKSQSKLAEYETPVFCQMRKLYGQRCMQDIEKLIKYHDFPKEGTLSSTRLKTVKLSIEEGSDITKGCAKKHVCGKCEKTINCWVEEADNRERRMLKKEKKNEEKATAPPQNEITITNTSYACAFPHETPPSYTIYPNAELQGLKVDPDLDCSPFPPNQPILPAKPTPAPQQRDGGARAAEMREERARTAERSTEGGACAAEPTAEGAHAAESFRGKETLPSGRRKRLVIRKTKQRKKGAQSYVLRSNTHARARMLESDGDFDLNPDTLTESDEEEEDFEIQSPKKTKNWDRTAKEERVSITAPMVEVMGTNSIELVYRPWNLTDMKEAMAHLPNPDDAGDRFATELMTFCQEFSPTLNELKRIMMAKLGGMNWHKISAELPAADHRRSHVNWHHASNDGYRAAVTGLTETVRRAFPARIDMSRVSHCRQEPGESVQVYYERLYSVFCKHSGLKEPADRGDRPTTWESCLANSLLNGLRPEISQAVKHSYIEWTEGRVSTIMKHALHAEDELRAKKERSRIKELQLAAVQRPQRFSGNIWGHNSDKNGCYLCGADDHIVRECMRCRKCKMDGHWAINCPELRKAD
ncbi:uncharacterized protein [Chanodichthys erythropterus]|uniref:uncharacterized protein n=1 Tax=Chanodichthys erythropterus TaxID=933992 RepID=UPI00351E2259